MSLLNLRQILQRPASLMALKLYALSALAVLGINEIRAQDSLTIDRKDAAQLVVLENQTGCFMSRQQYRFTYCHSGSRVHLRNQRLGDVTNFVQLHSGHNIYRHRGLQ
jgi:hypothetical protein